MKSGAFKFCPLCGHGLRRKKIDGRKRLFCAKCGRVNYENPAPVAAAAVKDERNRLLITKRNIEPGIGKWALPGGFIESGETPEEACLRELKEETGLTGRVERLLGAYLQRSFFYGTLIIIGYEVSVSNKNLSLNNELKEAKFFGKKEMPGIPFLSHRRLVKEFFRRYAK